MTPTQPRHRRDSLDVTRARTPVVYRDVHGQPVRGTPAASAAACVSASRTPLLWSGAKRVPGAASPNHASVGDHPGTPKANVGQQSGGTPLMWSGARRSMVQPAQLATPNRLGTPSRRLGGGVRRVSVADGCNNRTEGEPPPPPFAITPVAQAGDLLAFGTPNSAFRRKPERVADNSDDEPRESRQVALMFHGIGDEGWDDSDGPEAPASPAAAPRTPSQATSPGDGASPCSPAADGLRSGARRVPSIGSRAGLASPAPKSPGLALLRAAATPGSAVRLVQVRASASQRAETGSTRVVTPARRSTRVAAEPAPTAALLETTNFAYAPNKALAQRVRPGEEGEAGQRSEEEVAVEGLVMRQEAAGQQLPLRQRARTTAQWMEPERRTTSRGTGRRAA